jgi:lipoprotein signal peptidase
MSEYGEAHGHVERSPISVGWVVLASLVCGAGIFFLWLWLDTFDWLYFPGFVLVIVGAIMFLNDRAGLDHA